MLKRFKTHKTIPTQEVELKWGTVTLSHAPLTDNGRTTPPGPTVQWRVVTESGPGLRLVITRPLQLVVITVRVRVPRPRLALVSTIFFIFEVAYIIIKPDLPRIDLPHTQIYCSCFLPPGFTEYCISILRYFIISHLILVFCLHKSLIPIYFSQSRPTSNISFIPD